MNSEKFLLQTPIEYLTGVGPKKAEILRKEFNIFTFNDLLYYFPYRHVDKSKIYKISDLQSENTFVTLQGKITSYSFVGIQKKKRLVACFSDDTGSIELIWFNSIVWIENLLKQKQSFIVFGKATLFKGKWTITHPELIDSAIKNEHPFTISFQPLYNTSDKAKRGGLDSKAISKLVFTLLELIKNQIPEILSEELITNNNLIRLDKALQNYHFPANNTMLGKAITRLKFDELFFTQLRLIKLKILVQRKIKGYIFEKVGNAFNVFYKEHLSFELTNAQKRVIKEMRADMGSGRQMNRLLQGDVGSGKTVTSLLLMLIAIDNGFQTCLMAPTEILAQQHFDNISKLLSKMNINVEFLSGSTKLSQKKIIQEKLKSGEINIIIGTHALIEKDIVFYKLGLVVIDEQHRFGVEQRAKLWKKSKKPPHILVMTATPIPRTLAMTLYGDLDLSIIDELPVGRKQIITKHVFENKRLAVYGFMRNQIKEGRQIFVVYPVIEESEKLDLFALMEGHKVMSEVFPLPEYAISFVHGKMKSEDKDFEMQRFVKNQTNILLSTTVIEVGIDVPNATVMVIENAERFGLSQLHQLRGRVGRGGNQSYCILMTGHKLTKESQMRLKAMVDTTDGFEIANIDLKLRGPGDLQGKQQSGMLDFKVADIAKDEKLVIYTRNIAQQILTEDPQLQLPKNSSIAKFLNDKMKQEEFWGLIS